MTYCVRRNSLPSKRLEVAWASPELGWAGWLAGNNSSSASLPVQTSSLMSNSRPDKWKYRQTLAWAGISRSGQAHIFTLDPLSDALDGGWGGVIRRERRSSLAL